MTTMRIKEKSENSNCRRLVYYCFPLYVLYMFQGSKEQCNSFNFPIIAYYLLSTWIDHNQHSEQQSRGFLLTYKLQINMKTPNQTKYITYFRCLSCMRYMILAQQNKEIINHLPTFTVD